MINTMSDSTIMRGLVVTVTNINFSIQRRYAFPTQHICLHFNKRYFGTQPQPIGFYK